MFFKVFTFLALMAAALAGPSPNPNPKADPQYLAYSAPAVVPAVGYQTYSAYPAPVAYSAYAAPAAVPYAYTGAYYVR